MLTLAQALETSAALEERLSREKRAGARAALEERLAAADFVAFGLYKQAGAGQFLGELGRALPKPLAWGLGLGIPALGVGHMLISDAHGQGEDLIRDARNQALLTAAGIGGMQGIGQAIGGLINRPPTQREETQELTLPGSETVSGRRVVKLSEDAALRKLAALTLLDDVLERALNEATSSEKTAVEQCLQANRSAGAALLREIAR